MYRRREEACASSGIGIISRAISHVCDRYVSVGKTYQQTSDFTILRRQRWIDRSHCSICRAIILNIDLHVSTSDPSLTLSSTRSCTSPQPVSIAHPLGCFPCPSFLPCVTSRKHVYFQSLVVIRAFPNISCQNSRARNKKKTIFVLGGLPATFRKEFL